MAISKSAIVEGLACFDARALRFLWKITHSQLEVRAGRMEAPAPFEDPTLQAAWDDYGRAPDDHIEWLRATAAERLVLRQAATAAVRT